MMHGPMNIRYRTIVLELFFKRCGTWSFTMGEELGLSVSEDRVLSRIFGPMRGDVIRVWRKLHNEQLSYL